MRNTPQGGGGGTTPSGVGWCVIQYAVAPAAWHTRRQSIRPHPNPNTYKPQNARQRGRHVLKYRLAQAVRPWVRGCRAHQLLHGMAHVPRKVLRRAQLAVLKNNEHRVPPADDTQQPDVSRGIKENEVEGL